MLDFNRLLLLIAIISPLVVLARTARRAAVNRGWQLAALAVLGVTGLSWLFAREVAGFIGGGAWTVFLFLPAVGLRREAALVAAERYGAARRLLGALRWLHPVAALREEHVFLRAMEAAQGGETEQASALLQQLQGMNKRTGLQVVAQNFRIRGDWAGLAAWCRTSLPAVELGQDPIILPLYFRALGETGALSDLILQVAGRAPRLLASPQHHPTFDASVLMLLAFTGRVDAVKRLLRTRFRGMPATTREYWIATSELAAGEDAAGRTRLNRIRATSRNALLRADIARRMERSHALRAELEPLLEATVRRFEKNLARRRRSLLMPGRELPGPAVIGLMALNAVMFAFELWLGGTMDSYTLHRLGALQPYAVLQNGEYWRMLSALFLHYGVLHLLVNGYALYVLGPPLEASIGSLRFLAGYLFTGLASSVGVVTLWAVGWTQAGLLVGASGAVMGVVGLWAGMLLRHHRVPMARQRLFVIAMIVLIQTTFDFLTPQVSMAAHLSGLAAGFALGLLLARPRAVF